ncbi:MAG: SDR family NAD(P)-dependent oxidoreductase [Gordonia sp. (in: high G+C Gram-positive bacteria)]|uniref:SDR family NAD(P)-dependent oxidoreductase n=1 Tax=Gordonia sp. (in: high G+C Gram-positive bacteria) TaxID=84139 RepID=UPI0039E47BFE
MSRRALVVGGASGIGLSTLRALRLQGDEVIVADVNGEAADQVAAELGDGVTALTMDVTDEASVQQGFESAGKLDVVVNCAGLSIPGAITELELQGWQTTIDVCLTGTFLVLKHAGRVIADGGSIVCISSLNGRQPGAGMASYCAAKAGVTMLVEVAALEMAERGVRVNAVQPGLVDTPLTEGINVIPGLREDYLENTPLGRAGTPEDIAELIVFLASDKSSLITGAAFDINGGAHLQRYPDVLGKVRALMNP